VRVVSARCLQRVSATRGAGPAPFWKRVDPAGCVDPAGSIESVSITVVVAPDASAQ
jgi:hypothetical protein